MGVLDLNQPEFVFNSKGLSGVPLQVFRFTGHESISQPFEFDIELVSDNPNLNLSAPVGQAACLTLIGRLYDGSRYKRYIHGIVEEFVQLAAGIRHSRYHARLVSTIQPLHFTRNSRIFQNLSAPDVTRTVLRDGKIPDKWICAMFHSSYGSRDYCVQYQESDLNFVQRLWEEEGIFYFFEHTSENDTLTLGDGNHAFDSLNHYSKVRLRDQPHLYEEGLFEFQAGNAIRPGTTLLRDFKFKQPTLEMEAQAEADNFTDYRMYYSAAGYVDPALGQRLAKIRLEEQQCQRTRYIGTGNVRAMLPGYKFTLGEHRRRDCNQEYLVVSVQHEGTQPQVLGEEAAGVRQTAYQNRIVCIPAEVAFRPPRRIEPPTISGVQTAIVVGPPGEDIHCDEHGRVKVKFHWDLDKKKDDGSSCWIRVSQPWGGTGQGGIFIPRVGQEVVVQFLEGDPDRPLIVGRVYNGENPVPHVLPAAKNISTIRSASTPGGSGFNEMRYDDTAGSEHVFFHAQKDQHEVVGNDHKVEVKNNQTQNVAGSQGICVEGKGGAQLTVNHDYKIEGKDSITLTCGNSSIVMLPGRIEIRSGGGTWIALDEASEGVDIYGAINVNIHSADSVSLRGNSLIHAHSPGIVEIKGDQAVKINCE